MGKTLVFTGPRPQKLGGFEGEKALAVQVPLLHKLCEIVFRAWKTGGFDIFICGGALGTDQLVMEAVLHYKRQFQNTDRPMKLVVARPFPSQASAWPKYAQEKYERLCGFADEVVDVSPDPFTREKMQIRNEWMVNKGDALVAIWGGGGGGTGNCVRYARTQYKPILIVNPYTLIEKWEINKKARW